MDSAFRNFTGLNVTCGKSKCGDQRLYSYSRRNPDADEDGAHPWFLVVMVEGEPACPATLVHKQWVVTPTACVVHYIRCGTPNAFASSLKYIREYCSIVTPMRQISNPRVRFRDVGIFKENANCVQST